MEPVDVIERFSRLIGEGNVEAALALYEPNAAFVSPDGEVAAGPEALRSSLESFAALRPALDGDIESVVVAADTALVVNRWNLRGSDPDGNEVEMAGKSADVMRRGADGRWRILIDDPWGASRA